MLRCAGPGGEGLGSGLGGSLTVPQKSVKTASGGALMFWNESWVQANCGPDPALPLNRNSSVEVRSRRCFNLPAIGLTYRSYVSRASLMSHGCERSGYHFGAILPNLLLGVVSTSEPTTASDLGVSAPSNLKTLQQVTPN